MAVQSAGILVYRKTGNGIEVMLGHPGGPYWAKKDKGSWSIPKGVYKDNEAPLEAAKREFREEIGQACPEGEFIDLGSIKLASGKIISAWAIEGDLDVSIIKSNLFELEWPPKSGQLQQYPEIDQANWYPIDKAPEKLHKGQSEFIGRLAEKLGTKLQPLPEQSSLF